MEIWIAMRTDKPYTNATFTRRHDHEAGKHRPARAPMEPLQCERCGAVYVHRRWYPPYSSTAASARALGLAHPTVCVGCRREEAGVPSGYLGVRGGFYRAHHDEIEHLLMNESRRALEDNPTGRIIAWQRTGPGTLTLTTTTEHLAQRLGEALQKAFDGRVHFEFSHENKVAHVTWRRD